MTLKKDIITILKIEIAAGGGGGGSGGSCRRGGGGGGGGAGGYSTYYNVLVGTGDVLDVVVGKGGKKGCYYDLYEFPPSGCFTTMGEDGEESSIILNNNDYFAKGGLGGYSGTGACGGQTAGSGGWRGSGGWGKTATGGNGVSGTGGGNVHGDSRGLGGKGGMAYDPYKNPPRSSNSNDSYSG